MCCDTTDGRRVMQFLAGTEKRGVNGKRERRSISARAACVPRARREQTRARESGSKGRGETGVMEIMYVMLGHGIDRNILVGFSTAENK